MSVESSVGLQLFCFSSLCNWSGNLHHSLKQASAKLNPIMTLRFPAPFHSLVVFNLGSHWLLMIFSFSFWLAAVITLVWFYDTRSKCVHSPKRLPSWGPTRANEFSFKNTLRCDGVVFLRRKLHNVMLIYSTLLTENITIHIGNGFIVRQTVENVKRLYHVSL